MIKNENTNHQYSVVGIFFYPKTTIKSENSINRIYRKVGVNYRTQLYKA